MREWFCEKKNESAKQTYNTMVKQNLKNINPQRRMEIETHNGKKNSMPQPTWVVLKAGIGRQTER